MDFLMPDVGCCNRGQLGAKIVSGKALRSKSGGAIGLLDTHEVTGSSPVSPISQVTPIDRWM